MLQYAFVRLAAAIGASSAHSRTLHNATSSSAHRSRSRHNEEVVNSIAAEPQKGERVLSDTQRHSAEGWHGGSVTSHPEYGAEEYNFMEKVQAVGARKALKGTHNRLVIYAIIGGACAIYLFYLLTTRTYVLTTNKSPFKNSLFQHFPSDYAIVENKWTGRRTVEYVEELASSPTDAGTAPAESEALTATSTHPLSANGAMVTRELHTNILLHRVYLYLQPTNVVVLVDTDSELQPFRFVKGSIDVTRQSTAGWQRADQRLADSADTSTSVHRNRNSKRWSWWPRLSNSGSTAGHATPQSPDAGAAVEKSKSRLYIESRVRLLDDYNGYQRGSKPTYEHTLQTVVKTCLAKRYRDAIIARNATEVRPAYAAVMLQNGTLNGEGLALPDVIPDMDAFEREVFDEVAQRMGDRIILYEHSIRRF